MNRRSRRKILEQHGPFQVVREDFPGGYSNHAHYSSGCIDSFYWKFTSDGGAVSHRIGGPAMHSTDGWENYWVDGIEYTKEEYNQIFNSELARLIYG